MKLLLFSLLFAGGMSLPFHFSHALTLAIDAGHGGSDAGATRHGIKESDITLEVARLLHEKLEKESSVRSFLTRSSDVSLGLQERVDLAHAHKADLFLSIHVNASSDARRKARNFIFKTSWSPPKRPPIWPIRKIS